MIERLKTLVLIILSITAVFLLLVNLGLDLEEVISPREISEKRIFESTALFSDGFLPEEIIINFSEKEKTVIQNPRREGLWTKSEELLKEIFEEEGYNIISTDRITSDIYIKFLDQKSIILNFESKINLLTLLNSLGLKDGKNIVEKFDRLEEIYISLEKPFIIIKHKNGYHLLTMENMLTTSIEMSIGKISEEGYNPYQISTNIYDTNKAFYYPVVSKSKVQKVSFKNILENLDNQYLENILREFFNKEINYLREIKEEDMTIYADGSKILKINSNGLISFFNPDIGSIKERNLYISLKRALEFISANLGYDNSMYLKEIKLVETGDNKGFNFVFGKQTRGIKVDLDYEDVVDYIEIEVYNKDIKRYAQIFRNEKEQSVSYYELDERDNLEAVVKANLEEINSKLSGPDKSLEEMMKSIEYARVHYRDKVVEEKLGLYWKIIINSQEFLFNLD